jgi:hypothetical protein
MATTDGGNSEPGVELQFDKAELGAAAARTCSRCQTTIGEAYFTAGKDVTCAACAQGLGSTGNSSDLLRALGYGAGAALVGTLVWLLVMKIFNVELGLIAIMVGLLVGLAVRKGARGRGGPRYQALAMVLTYVSITSSYVPFVLKGIAEKGDTSAEEKKTGEAVSAEPVPPVKTEKASAGALVVAVVFVFVIALAAPFLAGANNIMGLFIIGIALYEAWKINRRIPLQGPFRIGTATGMPNATAPPAGEIPAPP